MRISLASQPGRPELDNVDWAAATASGVGVVLDGLSEAAQTGCRHGTGWYVRQLGTRLLALVAEPGDSIAGCLAAAIAGVSAAHGGGCDLGHPGSPGATVAVIRVLGASVEYFVLSDAVAVLDTGPDPLVVSDARVREHLPDLAAAAASGAEPALTALIEAQQRLRNRAQGYWVAQADPAAAGHGIAGEVTGARGALLLSDGAALLASDFGALSWRELLDLGYERGPDELIAATREVERRDAERVVWPRYKVHDDASAIVYRFDARDMNAGLPPG